MKKSTVCYYDICEYTNLFIKLVIQHTVEEGRIKFLHVVSYLLHLEPGCV